MRRTYTFTLLLALTVGVGAGPTQAEQGILVLQVSDVHQRPIVGLQIATKGDGGFAVTDRVGKARLRLSPQTKVGSFVSLVIAKAPAGTNPVFVSPWDSRAIVPAFENESDNFIPIILAERGDKMLLENGAAVLAIVNTVLNNDPRRLGPAISERSSKSTAPEPALVRASEKFGLPATQVQATISKWSNDPLVWKSIALTVGFEGSSFTTVLGNVDGGGISFGIMMWSLRLGSLQKLLSDFRLADRERFDAIFGGNLDQILAVMNGPREVWSTFADAISGPRKVTVVEPWKSAFAALGREPKFQQIQVENVSPWIQAARKSAAIFGFESERAFALFFDAQIQSGGFGRKDGFDEDIAQFKFKVGRSPDEVERMVILTNRSLLRVTSPFRDSVRSRRMTIALGKGLVYGREYNLDELGLGLREVLTGKPIPTENDHVILERLLAGRL